MVMEFAIRSLVVVVTLLLARVGPALSATDPSDLAVLLEFRDGLDNPEILEWPDGSGGDPCGDRWKHVYCDGAGRVSQLQAQSAGLSGVLPASFSKLTALTNLGFQGNQFRGPLPSFSAMTGLKWAFLNNNNFSSIPFDFFDGLSSALFIALDKNPLNASSGGWTLPPSLTGAAQLVNLSLTNCGLVGPIPAFLGQLPNLQMLTLSFNSLIGPIPATFAGSTIQTLWLNNQNGDQKLSGPIDALASMPLLHDAWLHGNSFSGRIPAGIGACTQLWRLWLNSNRLIGVIPANITSLPNLQSLRLDNNMLMGPIPKVTYNFTYGSNSFCSDVPGTPCTLPVNALLGFLDGVGYPDRLASSWAGNNPCSSSWVGVSCSGGQVVVINLPNFGLSGVISSSLGQLGSLVQIKLQGNNLTGEIPANLTKLKSLKLLNLSSNNLAPPMPVFGSDVSILTVGNPLLNGAPLPPPSSGNSPPSPSQADAPPLPPASVVVSPPPSSGGAGNKSSSVVLPLAILAGVCALFAASAVLFFCLRKRQKRMVTAPSIVVHPQDPSDPDNLIKIVVAHNASGNGISDATRSGSTSIAQLSDCHVVEASNLQISVQVLSNATQGFARENVLGRGGFGVVYKGELHDGTIIAVKRMESVVVSCKALDEFQAEIHVLTRVRHRNLVSILGYSIEGNERMIVYEYMPNGALSKHLFHWQQLGIEPLTWKKRLNIALDVARGMEYLHNLGHQTFIHRDLKSANILLADDFRAKVSDFGLVKLAPEGKDSVATRLAGTFGYLAPEYAVTGKITTKADVFSFGVVLMELVTGMVALDERRSEETRYLASWFFHMCQSKDRLRKAIDPTIDLTEDTFECVVVVSELACHCATREPSQRPDMGHAVTVLGPMVEKWKPASDGMDGVIGLDLHQPLLQMVKSWQDADGQASSGSAASTLYDSKGSIPARPAGFAESFTSADGR